MKRWHNSDSSASEVTTVCSDVVLETRILVSRRLEDKNESLALGLEHYGLGLGLEEKVWQFPRLLLQFLTAVSKAHRGIL